MKKLFLVGALALFGATMNAQDNSIKVNPAALLGGSDLVIYEHRLGDNISAAINGGYGGFKIGDNKYKSYGGGLQFRYYFTEAMTGFYGAVLGGYNAGSVEISNSFSFDPENTKTAAKADYSGISAGARVGYQWIFDSGFTLDLNAGASYRTLNYKWNSTADETFYQNSVKGNGILPSGAVGLGYSF